MRSGTWKKLAALLLAVALLPCGAGQASGQTVSAIPKLDLDKFMGTWYEIARLPNKTERHCVSHVQVLFALGDKKGTFQMGTSCTLKDGMPDDYDNSGKLDKLHDGKLKLGILPLFTSPYWVLATGPDYEWALVGTPKHKTLWILSRNTTLDGGTLNQIKSIATAQGFDLAKLVTPSQGH